MAADHLIPTMTPALLLGGTGNAWPSETVHRLSRVEEMIFISRAKSAIDAVDYARQCIRVAQSPADRRRRKFVSRRRALIDDSWQGLLYADMQGRLRPELHAQVLGQRGEFCDISRNPAKNIWQETAVLYKGAAQRETPETPQDAELYRRIMRGTMFATFMRQVEFELLVFNDLILWPTTVMRHGKKELQHNKAAGDTVTAIFDPELGDREPFALVFTDSFLDGRGVERERYMWWTQEWRAVFADDEDLVRLDPVSLTPIDDGDPLANAHGMLFTYLHIDPYHPTFWNQSQGDELVELALKVGRQQTQTNDLFNRAGHKQLVSHGSSLRRGEKSLLDVGAHIMVHGDGSSFVVDWSVDFESRQRVIDADEARAAGTYGINPERLRKTSYQTAEGARLTERPLQERRHKMREPMSDAERDYRAAVITVAHADGLVPSEEIPDPDVWMEVTHAPIAYPGDPAKQIDVDEREVALGIISIVDVMQRRYPGISRDEALRLLEANLDIRRRTQEIKQAASIPDNPEVRSSDDEEAGRLGPAVRDRDNGQPDPGSPPGDQTA